jgi:hypothetical protein
MANEWFSGAPLPGNPEQRGGLQFAAPTYLLVGAGDDFQRPLAESRTISFCVLRSFLAA